MKPLRVAVIGVGHLGRIHARLLAQVTGVELSAIVDPIPEARAAATTELNVPAYPDCAPLYDDIDAAIIATPSRLHHAVAHDLLSRGKHVFVEKPLTLNVGDADDLIREAAGRQLILQVGHVERFNPALDATSPHLKHPKYINAVRSGPFTCRSTDIGVVLDLMIHDIDIALSLVDDEIASVHALGAAVIGPNEDWAQARLNFAGGCVANFFASRVAWQPQRTMEIVSRDCTAAIDFAAPAAKIMRIGESIGDSGVNFNDLTPDARAAFKEDLFREHLPLADLQITPVNALLEEQRSFFAAIRGESAVRVTGSDGRRALDVAERILTGIATHRWDGSIDGAVGPRFASRERVLRGPHWQRGRQPVERRKAG